MDKEKKSPEKKVKPATSTTRIDAELLDMAKAVAAIKRIDLRDYLHSLIREPIREDYRRMVRQDHQS